MSNSGEITPELHEQEFVCLECGKKYALAERFENKPICISCVTASELGRLLPDNHSALEESIVDTLDSTVKDIELPIKQQSRNKVKRAEQKGEQVNNSDKVKMTDKDWIIVSAGEFSMGSPLSELGRGDDERLHQVDVAEFEMMISAVTFEQYDVFCSMTGRDKLDDKGWGRDKYPVISVSYWDAVDYSLWLSEQMGWVCRLPTEAEWEYAARAGTNSVFNSGDNISCAQANYDGIYTYDGGGKGVSRWKTMPVRSFKPNAWGFYDMHGNVWEWCASEYDAEYSGLEAMDASFDRMNNIPRSLRGGSWHSRPGFLRSACRYRFSPQEVSNQWGFRLVRAHKGDG